MKDTATPMPSPMSWHDATKQEIVGEMEFYPVSHFLLPLIYFKMVRKVDWTLIVFMFWEFLEQFIVYVAGGFAIYPGNTAKVPDSILSDGAMGFLGLLLGIYYAFVLDLPRYAVPVLLKEEVFKMLRYHFQFLTIASLTVLLEITVGKVQLGYLIFWLGTVALLVLYALWNHGEDRWKLRLANAEGRKFEAGIGYKHYRVTLKRYVLEELYFASMIFLVFASAYHRYDGVFVMMSIDFVVLVLFLTFVALPLRNRMFPEGGLIRDRKGANDR